MGFDGEEVSRLKRVKRKSRKELSLKRFAGLLVLLVLQLVLGTNAAYAALSASCTAVNALSGSSYSASYAADYRFGPDFVAGLGLGFGRDVSDIASSGTQSKGNAASAALYASYHPGQLFVDTLLGYSYLNFDSHRYITDSGGSANGSRNGQQFFGALSSGYEFQWQNLMLSPYGRLQFSTTLLRHYTETGGGDYNLSYANQRINTLALVGGLRSQYGVPTSWGALRLTGRLEYSQSLKGDSVATMGYADVGNDTYAVTVLGLDQNTLSASAGIEFLLRRGWTLGLSYQGSTSMDSSTHENTLIVRGVYKY